MKIMLWKDFVVVALLSQVWLCDPMGCSMPGFPVLHCPPEFAQTHIHWVDISSNHLFLLPPSPPVFNLSQHPSLYRESALHIRWPKHWSFSFSISSSNEYLGLISFRIDWFDFLAIQGTPKSLLQHLGSKALILQCSAFFMVELSHPYSTTGKTITLTIWIFVGEMMSLFFNMLSRCVIAFWKITEAINIWEISSQEEI